MTRSTTVQAASLAHDQIEPAGPGPAAGTARDPSASPKGARPQATGSQKVGRWLKQHRGWLLLLVGVALVWFTAPGQMVAFVTALVPMPPAGATEDALQWPESTASALRLLVAALGLYLFLRRDIGVTENRLNIRIDDTKEALVRQIDSTNRRIDDTNSRIDDTKEALVKQIGSTNIRIADTKEDLVKQIGSTNSRIDDTNKRVDDTKADLTKRIDDTKADLTKQIDDAKADLTKQIDDASAETRRRFDRLEGLLLASVQDRSERPSP